MTASAAKGAHRLILFFREDRVLKRDLAVKQVHRVDD
jgi:hypothetical protein